MGTSKIAQKNCCTKEDTLMTTKGKKIMKYVKGLKDDRKEYPTVQKAATFTTCCSASFAGHKMK